MKPRKAKVRWYKFYIGECPVCGSNASFKEGMRTMPPKRRKDRYEYLSEAETYDYCL